MQVTFDSIIDTIYTINFYLQKITSNFKNQLHNCLLI